MSEIHEEQPSPGGPSSSARPSKSSTRAYVILAAILLVVILVTGAYLVKVLLLSGSDVEPAIRAQVTPSLAPTFTPVPTPAPTTTPPPSPTSAPFVMTDDYTAVYGFVSAGARPSTEWTGFFGQVLNAKGEPAAGVPLIVLYTDGTPVELAGVPTSPVTQTDAEGTYEIRLAGAPLAGLWSLLVLTEDGRPASDFMTFETDLNVDSGTQQVQVIWQQKP